MHAEIIEVASQRTLILGCGESGKTFFVDEASKRIKACN
jgi:hypothetical protein